MNTAWIWTILCGILVVGSLLALLMALRGLFVVEGLAWNQRPMDQLARKGQTCRVLRTLTDPDPESQARIELVSETCEDGLPHTVSPNKIRMTETVWKSPRRDEILTHERVHLQQRQDPDIWERFYMEEWGYTFPSEVPPQVADRKDIRSNPDTWDSPFPLWQNRYWFVPVYDDTNAPRLRDTHVEIWDSQTQSWSSTPPKEWQTTFCGEACPHQYEHPHEIAAEYSTSSSWKTPAAHSFQEFQKRYGS